MPKVGMEPIRRKALVQATIAEIGKAGGSLDVTVAQIAKRAGGVSSALAHHYFGGKDQIFLAAMRHILTLYGAQVRATLSIAKTPRARIEAIIHANFEAGNFRPPEVISAWLNFYVLSQSLDGGARRLLRVYQARLHSNLAHDLRPLVGGDQADDMADKLAAMIDGLYIRHALRDHLPDGKHACDQVLDCLDMMLGGNHDAT